MRPANMKFRAHTEKGSVGLTIIFLPQDNDQTARVATWYWIILFFRTTGTVARIQVLFCLSESYSNVCFVSLAVYHSCLKYPHGAPPRLVGSLPVRITEGISRSGFMGDPLDCQISNTKWWARGFGLRFKKNNNHLGPKNPLSRNPLFPTQMPSIKGSINITKLGVFLLQPISWGWTLVVVN